MKRSIIAAAVLTGVFMSGGAFADTESDYGELIIKGKVVGTTCKFINDNTAEIGMNPVGADVLTETGVGNIYTGYINSTTTPLTVQCTGDNTPKITFSRSQFDDSHQTITKNTNGSNGAGFAVYFGNSSVPVDPTQGVELNKAEDGKYTLNFSARYANLAGKVEPGPVESTLTLTVVTD
ncbi:TPA: fimbrial protein YehD [Citrobacter freundii]